MRSAPTTLVPVLVVALLIAAAGVGCARSGERTGPGEPSPLAAKIAAGLGDPNPLIRQAWSMIRMDIEQNEETSRQLFADQGTKFTDAEITALELADRFDSIAADCTIEVYRLEYRMRPLDMSKIMLAGGMNAQDGWLLSVGSMGRPYLVARVADGERSYLGTIYPDGEGQGPLNATLELLYRLEVQAGGNAATSPIKVTRAFAITEPDLSPQQAAEHLVRCFIESLREDENLDNPKYKTFVLTDYKDLGFKMYPTTSAPAEYPLESWEISDHSWIVEPSVAYQYKGTISPIGDGESIPADQWVTELYQDSRIGFPDSRIGFLMARDGDSYTFRSRYMKPTDVRFAHNPSGARFIESIVDRRGSVTITKEMRERFNLFARDYRLFHMPDMDGYESFFEADGYAGALGYTNFADAVAYVLSYMGYPETMSDEAMQDAIQTLFVAKGSYQDMPHQAYRKFANYQDGYYSPWPQGGLDPDRTFYLLTAMDIAQDENRALRITVHAKSYYFEDTSVYEAGENEKWLNGKAKELGMPELQAAARLIADGAMDGISGDNEYETTIYILVDGPHGLNPRFVSNRRSEVGK